MARLSTEIEYRAVAHATTESLWVQLLREIDIVLAQCPILWCDNINATNLIANAIFQTRTKHVEIDYHFVRENVQQKTLDVRFISSKDQLADGVTKPIVSAIFAFLRARVFILVDLEGTYYGNAFCRSRHISKCNCRSRQLSKCNCTSIPGVNYLLSMYIPLTTQL